MSVVKVLQDYLAGYRGMELRPISEVLTDMTESASSYALAPSGNGKVTEDILGNKTYENNYQFFAREAAANETDRQETYDFLEDFCDWLEEQNEEDHLPQLPGRYLAEELTVTNLMLFDIDEDGTGTYQVQLKLIFTKRKEGET